MDCVCDGIEHPVILDVLVSEYVLLPEYILLPRICTSFRICQLRHSTTVRPSIRMHECKKIRPSARIRSSTMIRPPARVRPAIRIRECRRIRIPKRLEWHHRLQKSFRVNCVPQNRTSSLPMPLSLPFRGSPALLNSITFWVVAVVQKHAAVIAIDQECFEKPQSTQNKDDCTQTLNFNPGSLLLLK